MIKKIIFYSYTKYIFIFFLILLGIITSKYKGYGDDIDSHALILSFINIIENGIYSPSRYYGYPFAEIFYGFLGYFFGSFASSLISYVLFLGSIFFISKTFIKKKLNEIDFLLIILICFSNPILYFDNTNPSDAPLALFLFSIGAYLFYKKYNLYSAIFFALAIATRANYALFVLFIIFYELIKFKKINLEIFKILIYSSIISLLFYLPILIMYKFSFSFITNPGGPDIDITSLLPRFIFKTYLSYGIYSSIALFFLYVLNYKKVNGEIKKNKILTLIIVLNLLTFFFMPTKTSIISLSVILSYIFILKIVKKKSILICLILLNLFSYFVTYQIFEFKYKFQHKCDPIEAIDAKFNFKLKEGFYFSRTKKMKDQIYCSSILFKKKSFKYLNGKKLK